MITMEEFRLSPRRVLRHNDLCTLKRLRGTFRFDHASISDSGEISLTFIGGPAGHYCYRSVRPDRVKSIMRKVQ